MKTEDMRYVAQHIARYIDHTLLKPEATPEAIHQLCQEAERYQFASVCVNPPYVKLAAELLRETPVQVCSVVGFPFGTHKPEVKALETRLALADGAREIDMVIQIGALKAGDEQTVLQDVRAVVKECESAGAVCKVIIETAVLEEQEKIRACQIAKEAGAHFVKTSTGFASGGATVEDVALMRRTVGDDMGVKASGGVRSFQDALKMIEAGATRIGTSSGVRIYQEAQEFLKSLGS